LIKKYEHIIPIIILIPIFIYVMYSNIDIASKKVLVDQENNINIFYNISAQTTPEIQTLAQRLKNESINANDDVYVVQNLLDYVTNIPYKVHHFRARKPLETIQRNYGDCDDKSNLMSSLLNSLGFENYIVLVPEHAFVIVNIPRDFENQLLGKKSFYLNNKNFYILETTAQNSKIGFNFKYHLFDIDAIVDPINKKTLDISNLEYQ
jgi:hypothetical protein